jgi:hypothetical protein
MTSPADLPPLPAASATAALPIAFKEWSLVCEELAAGRTSLILRKGGIAEGRAGFEWKHGEFYLFPTHFHEQAAGMKVTPGSYTMPEEGFHRLDYLAKLDGHYTLTDWNTVSALRELHPWTDGVVEERFAYGTAGSLSVALVRVYRLAEPVTFADAPGYGGCRSWVKVPAPSLPTEAIPVLSDAAHAQRKAAFLALLDSAIPASGVVLVGG